MDTTIEKELTQIDSLLERGIEFQVPTKSFAERLIYGKNRKFEIAQLCFGALDLVTNELLHINIDDEAVKNSPLEEADRLASENAYRLSRIVAIAVLNDKLVTAKGFNGGNIVFTKPNLKKIDRLAKYFMWRLNSQTMLQITLIVRQLMNSADFMNSIRLIKGTIRRTTQPAADLVEEEM